MANRIEQARAAVDACIREAYLRAVAAGELPEGAEIRGSVEQPKDTANGDFAANHAMASAKTMHMAPRKIAEALIAHMELGGSWFSGVEAAGPGFLNFRLSDKWYQDVLSRAPARTTAAWTTVTGRRSWWSSCPPTQPAP